MRTFDIYTHAQEADEAVKQGYSWPACLIGTLWAFSKGLIGTGLLLFVALLFMRVLPAIIGPLSLVVNLLILYMIGTQGNDWRRSKLIKKGYTLQKTIEAKNAKEAIAEYHKLFVGCGEEIATDEITEYATHSENDSNSAIDFDEENTFDPQELFRLGMKYYDGDGVSQSYEKSCELFLKAAEQGNAAAQTSLGNLYDHGKGVAQDYKTALKWYQLAADQGYASAEFCVGVFYRDGLGVSQDYCKAITWIYRSANNGYDDAQFNLGVMYLNGHGVSRNFDEAAKWWRLSAHQGNMNAKTNLALLESRGMI